MPTSTMIFTSSSDESGASLEGSKITVHPTASAGPSLHTPIDKGKLHGVIAATTPMGHLMVDIRLFGVPGTIKKLEGPLAQ
jgi:hypothetical protein